MSDAQAVLSDVALTTYRLHGQVNALAEDLARPVGLTAAWWQVLGAVLGGPDSVSGVARQMGMTRQSVQRIADLLVDRDLARWEDNPAHRRAKLLVPTSAGRDAVRRIDPAHADAAARLVDTLGEDRAAEVLAALHDLSAALEVVRPD